MSPPSESSEPGDGSWLSKRWQASVAVPSQYQGSGGIDCQGWPAYPAKKASAQRMAVLAFKDDRAVFKHRNDHGSARMMEILSGRDHTVRRFNGIFVHLKEGSFVGDSAVNQFLS